MRLKNKGFTLIEMMIVVAIIGILALVISPNFNSSREQFTLYTTARSCVSDLRYTQQLSMDTKVQHGMYFTQNGYQIIGSEVVKKVDFDGLTYQTIFGASSDAIVFQTDGTPIESGKIDLKSNISDMHIYISVTPGTGEVSVQWE